MVDARDAAADGMRLIAETWEVEPGGIRQVVVPGHAPLALVRIGDAFYLIDDTCTHGAASLADGALDGAEIECPFHGGRFDVRTGEARRFPCTEPLQTYPVRVDGEKIYAALSPATAPDTKTPSR